MKFRMSLTEFSPKPKLFIFFGITSVILGIFLLVITTSEYKSWLIKVLFLIINGSYLTVVGLKELKKKSLKKKSIS
jgi:hypothetical protein